MDAAPSTATLTASNSTATATASPVRGGGGRGRGGFQRGGRGGRGASPDGRGGRGGGRGAARGDRGRGRGDGGRGRGRGHRGGFPSHRPTRHRSLSGKHGSRPHGAADGERPAKRERKDQKPNSNFALMHSLLGDAAMIAEYIRDYHGSEKFRDPKSVNGFLQAISQRPESVYEELMGQHKDAVFTVLERLFALYALGKQTMFPSAHEFLIRCEQAGVRKAAWGEGVKTLPVKAPPAEADEDADAQANGGGAAAPRSSVDAPPQLPAEATSLLSPRELLKKLAALDPVGRLQRIIELSTTVEDVQVCAKKLAALLGEEGSDKFDYAAQCQVISKLLSKARRVVEPAFAPPPKASEDGAAEEKKDEEGEEKEKEEEEAEAKQEGEEGSAIAPAPSPPRRRDPLTAEEIETFQSALSTALHALESVLQHRAPNVPQQPLSKFSKVLEWCKAQGLMAAGDERFIAVLEEVVESDLAQQATQLETVITLKSLTAGDSAALTEVAEQLWNAGAAKCFAPSSVDVLSAIAVAAGAPGVSAEARRLVADRLVQTQQHLADTVVLPRRALRFVNEERNKVKQAAIAKQLEDEAVNYGRSGAHAASTEGREGESEEEEEEDMALERA